MSRKKPTLREFFEKSFAPEKLAHVTPGCRRTYFYQLGKFSKFLGREARLTDLTVSKDAKYAAWLNRQPITPGLRYDSITILRRVWKYAHEQGLAHELPPPIWQAEWRRVPLVPRKPPEFVLGEPIVWADPERPTLREFLDRYIHTRTDVQQTTRALLVRAKRSLEKFLGADRKLTSISPGDADEFRRHLMTIMGENSARRMCGRAKQFFRAAIRKRLISENPFADMRGMSVRANTARQFYVTREMAEKVLAACPSARWRLIFALARFGGLRTPSEHFALDWSDVDWAGNKLRVPSPKTAYCGKPFRVIPLFTELRPYLEEMHAAAGKPEAGPIITRPGRSQRPLPDTIDPYRPCQNLGTSFKDIVRRAGVKPWPKPFQNLRSTRQTELADTYPIHVVCAWLGNTEIVAREHYLQVTEKYFEQASGQGGAA